MRPVNRSIIRIAILIMYMVMLSFILFGISSVFSYLNTGADRSSMLHNKVEKVKYYFPKLEWTSLENNGRPMDRQTLKSIEEDYLDAWYVRQIALKTNDPKGIDDYYTKHARQDIKAYIDYNKDNQIHVESTTLEHHIKVEFFSADGKLIVLTDKGVIEYKRLYKSDQILDEIKEKSTYKIILLLEDGFWRIRHLQKIESNPIEYNKEPRFNEGNTIDNNVKGINYYPQNCPWDMYGDCFNVKQLDLDFEIIKLSGLNTVRLFIPYEEFGGGYVANEKLEKVKVILDVLKKHNLKAIITLFDFYGNYNVLDWTLNQRHLEQIVNPLKGHEALQAWDIKNEPDLDFKSRGRENVLAWLLEMTDYVNHLDTIHPVTIGWSSPEAGGLLQNYVDIVSFHYYKSADDFEQSYNQLKEEVKDKTIILQEFGASSYRGFWNPFGYSEDDQAEYYEEMQKLFETNNVQYLAWTLYDFEYIPESVVGRLPWRKNKQTKFGFIDTKGNKKPSFEFISKY